MEAPVFPAQHGWARDVHHNSEILSQADAEPGLWLSILTGRQPVVPLRDGAAFTQ
jgi:hypothetical protein